MVVTVVAVVGEEPVTQGAGEEVDLAQKCPRPKHAFFGPKPPREQRLLKSFC